ncbi:MAG: polysaccharide deacetylase family protein [Candidatus Marinimicrobia bacterium]|nr:polysaccharide deacetylase family protein [Candidatus Neomarinimicrobiota bacterium]
MKYPVLAYHKVSRQWELSFTMMFPEHFERQMRYLAAEGYVGRSLREYLADPKENEFVLTFDDAYECVFEHAFPVLKELGFHATVFVLSDFIGKDNTWDFIPGKIYSRHMNQEQLRNLHASGWEIASHGKAHRVMIRMTEDAIRDELYRSREVIASIIRDDVHTFCFPFGVYDEHVVAEARKAGYDHLVGFTGRPRFGVISRSAVYRVADNPRTVLRKIRMSAFGMTIEKMKELFYHSFSLLTRIKHRCFGAR